jgi:hypothetical protein
MAMRRANSGYALGELRACALLDERVEDSMNIVQIVQKVGLARCLCAALVMSSGCATSDEAIDENQSQVEATISAHVLHLTVGGLTSIQSPGTPTQWLPAGSRDYAFLHGSTVTLKEWGPDNNNCLMFHHWTGACAGQFTTCTLVMNSDLTTEAVWVPIKGCSPR